MDKRRQEKMSVEIRRLLSAIIKDNIKDPRIDVSAVSVTRVDVPQDISHARVYISILGDAEKQNDTMLVLQKAKGYIRSELAQGLLIRHEQGIRISTLLDSLHQEAEAKENRNE